MTAVGPTRGRCRHRRLRVAFSENSFVRRSRFRRGDAVGAASASLRGRPMARTGAAFGCRHDANRTAAASRAALLVVAAVRPCRVRPRPRPATVRGRTTWWPATGSPSPVGGHVGRTPLTETNPRPVGIVGGLHLVSPVRAASQHDRGLRGVRIQSTRPRWRAGDVGVRSHHCMTPIRRSAKLAESVAGDPERPALPTCPFTNSTGGKPESTHASATSRPPRRSPPENATVLPVWSRERSWPNASAGSTTADSPAAASASSVAMMVSSDRQVWSVLFGGPDGYQRHAIRVGVDAVGQLRRSELIPSVVQCTSPRRSHRWIVRSLFAAGACQPKQPLRRRPQAYTARR